MPHRIYAAAGRGACDPRHGIENRHRDGRWGFTLVELLVVMAIIGVLVGMITPAVHQARESGRKAVCLNNLRQIGIALQAYESQNRTLPIGSWYNASSSADPGDSGNTETESGGSMLHFILPYLGEQNLYDLFDWQTVYAAGHDAYGRPLPMLNKGRCWNGGNPPSNSGLPAYTLGVPLYSVKVSTFVCPSDDLHGIFLSGSTPYALSNYVASLGSKNQTPSAGCTCDLSSGDPAWSNWFNMAQQFSAGLMSQRSAFRSNTGPFMRHWSETMSPKNGYAAAGGKVYPAVSFAQIRDGLSSTILCGEARASCNGVVRSLGWTDSWNGCALMNTNAPINYDTCDGTNSLCSSDPCHASTDGTLSRGFKSAHFGGCNFAFCDASVHWLAQNIDPIIYQCLGAIDDGQPIPAETYASQ